jgi:hypothetical protein
MAYVLQTPEKDKLFQETERNREKRESKKGNVI